MLPTLLALLVCTASLLWWLTGVVPDVPAHTAQTRRGWFALVVTLTAGAIFALQTFIRLCQVRGGLLDEPRALVQVRLTLAPPDSACGVQALAAPLSKPRYVAPCDTM